MDIQANQRQLLDKYLVVCNKALHRNADRFPFKQLLKAAAEDGDLRQAEVNFLDSDVQPEIIFSIHENQIVSRPCMCQGCGACRPKWTVSQSYLEDVIANPAEYISNPAKIDWEWAYLQKNQDACKSLQGNSDEQAAQE